MVRNLASGGNTPEPPQDHHRASDADRQQVADRLREALDEGRLTLLEYDERLGSAYAALTYGELAAVTRDLPEPAGSLAPLTGAGSSSSPSSSAVPPAPSQPRKHLIQQARGWLGAAVLTNGIWLATTMPHPSWDNYWPGVVMGIWGACIVGSAIDGKRHRAHGGRELTD